MNLLSTAFGTICLFILGLTIISASDDNGKKRKPPETVEEVDFKKYAGLWYEIARMPNRFQKKCAGETTAEYRLREDGKITVINQCLKLDGKIDRIEGIAKVVNPPSNSKLKVSFFNFLGLSLFWGDYWIIGLDSDYHWAIVGSPNRKYGWILARNPELNDEQMNKIYRILEKQGYTPDAFQATRQSHTGKATPESGL
jgi:apolipoprotein D and lipocalin family protein